MRRMRIIKSNAIALLEAENQLLEAQKVRCGQQTQKLANFSLAGMKGDAADSLGLRTKAQAAIAEAHLAFFDSLAGANRANMGLIRALPETSPGVLDTAAAEGRLLEARDRIGSLEREMGEALDAAQRTNQASEPFNRGSAGYNAPPVTVIDTNVIRQNYDGLMRAQQIAAQQNQMILDKARDYDQASLRVYQSVETASLWQSIGLCKQYAECTYAPVANMSPVERLDMMRELAGLSEDDWQPQEEEGIVQRIEELGEELAEGLSYETSVSDVHAQASGEVLGMAASGEAAASFLGVSAFVKPYFEDESEYGKKYKSKVGVGVKAGAEAHVLKEHLSGSYGAAKGSADVEVLTGAVSGKVGAWVDRETGKAKAGVEVKAEASALKLSGKAVIGDDDYNVHANVNAKILTASGKLGLTFSKDGIDASVGAEAYLATGEISGGLTFMGIKVDAVGEAKIGGAGAIASLVKDGDMAELDLGIGLFAGVGTKIKVDWSGFPKAWNNAMDNVWQWWDDNANKLYWYLYWGGGGSHRY